MEKISSQFAKNILATIVYYDVLEFPLTEFEIWKNLIRTDYYSMEQSGQIIELEDIVKELKGNALTAYIEHKNGFYLLKGRSDLIDQRITNGKISAKKLKDLRRIVWILRFVPFIRMIGVTGRMAMKNARPKSDWDLLIVLKSGRIWIGRTLVTLLLQLIGKRRYGNKVADRVCLNYFITDKSLEVITKDLFSASEYIFLFPLFGRKVHERFQIKNEWIRNMKPTYMLTSVPPLKMIQDTKYSVLIRKLLEKVFESDVVEKKLGKIEKQKILQNPKTTKEGSLIHAYDDALVFLPDPHGPIVFEKFKRKMSELLS